MNEIYLNERESKQVFNAIKQINDLMEEIMTENKALKKDRDYYKKIYMDHRAELDKD